MILELIVFVLFVKWFLGKLRSRFFPAPLIDSKGKWVLITGCDTGFGNMLCKRLDAAGFNVVACCLTEQGIRDVTQMSSDRVVCVQVDITKEADVRKAAEVVRSRTDQLHAVVNNAGINQGSLVEWTSMDQYRRVTEVNYLGGVCVTKTMLPFIMKSKGRIVNITSIAGVIASPGLSAYCGAKHAFEAFTNGLRREVTPWGVSVHCVNPGFMRTPIVTTIETENKRLWDNLSPEVKKRWGEEFYKDLTTRMHDVTKGAEDPKLCIDALVHAIHSSRPKDKYWPGFQASYVLGPVSMLPHKWIDFIMGRLSATKVMPAAMKEELEAAAKAERKSN